MEEKFIAAWLEAREKAGALGIRLRPLAAADAMRSAHRCLSGSRTSEGFGLLCERQHLELSLEALVTDRRFTALFSDAEANTALNRLLDAGFYL